MPIVYERADYAFVHFQTCSWRLGNALVQWLLLTCTGHTLVSNHEEIVNEFYVGCLLRLFATIIVAESKAKSYVFAIRSCKAELIPSDHHESGAHKGRDGTSLPLFHEL